MKPPLTYPEFAEERDRLDRDLLEAGNVLSATRDRLASDQGIAAFGKMNMTPDSVKGHADYRRDHAALNASFERLRALGGQYAKRYAKEIRADIHARRLAKLEKRGASA